MDNWKYWVFDSKNRPYVLSGLLILFILPIALILVNRVQNYRSNAALPDKLETEGGTLSSTGVTTQSDTTASGGQYVLFQNQTASPTPPSGPTPTPTSNGITYIRNVTIPGTPSNPGVINCSGALYQIFHDGSVDSSPGINCFIQQQPDGDDSTHHTRIIFPTTSVFRIDTAITTGGKNHMTLWGHANTSSAWIRGDTTIYPDPGARINVSETAGSSNPNSAFVTGSTYRGYKQLNFAKGGSDVIIRGFDIYGSAPTPGIYQSSYEVHASVEMGTQKDAQFAYNRSRGMGGDLVRFRTSERGWVHHNYVLTTGRMAGSFIVNPSGSSAIPANVIFENNTIDRAGYWCLDVETEDESDSTIRYLDGITIRNNIFGTCNDGWLVIEWQGLQVHVADIIATGNVIDGTGYSTYGGHRDMLTSINNNLTTSATPGSDPRIQRVTISDNRVTQTAQNFAGPIVNARYVDGLTVTNNDGNLSSGSFLSTTNSTSVTNTGNN